MAEISLPEWVQTQMARLDREIEKSLSLENGELRALPSQDALCAWAVVSDVAAMQESLDYVLAVTVTLFEGKVKRKTRPPAQERAISKIDVGLWYCENDIAVDSWVKMALGAIWTSINTTVKDIKSRARWSAQFEPSIGLGNAPRYPEETYSPVGYLQPPARNDRSRQQYNGGSYSIAPQGDWSASQPTVVTDGLARPVSQYQDFGRSQAARNVYEPQYYEVSVPLSVRERELANGKAAAMQAAMNQQMQAAMDQMGAQLGMNVFGLSGTRAGTPIPTPLQSAPGPKIVVAAIGSSRRRIILEDE